MCGIAGILRVHPPGSPVPPHEVAIPEAWLDILDASIKHRGPDGQGRFRDRAVRADGTVVDVAFVHRRLSILDHAGGAQPMVSMNGPKRARRTSEGSAPIPGAESSTSAREHDATFQGLALPVLFHGAPDSAVRYTSLARERETSDSRGRRAPADANDLVAVVFNGCIYNHRELRRELQAAGHEFVSDHSDTEVLLHGWREWGEKLPDHLEGMFAFILWDRNGGKAVLARDSFGEKPLNSFHMRQRDAWVNAFSSNSIGSTSLAQTLGPSLQPNPPGWSLWYWIKYGFAPHDPAQNALTILPAQLMRYEQFEGGASMPRTRYFGPLSQNDARARPRRDCTATAVEIEPILSDAVHRRLDADVPIGCFLSGGVDSSLIAALAARRTDLQTFTVRMPDPAYDESAYAESVARYLGTRHRTLGCDAHPAEDLVGLVRQIGMPFGDSSLLPSFWVSRAARKHVAVALSGDGGDELFLGYERYRVVHWLNNPTLQFASQLVRVPPGSDPRSLQSKVSRLLSAGRQIGYLDLLAIFDTETLSELISNARPTVLDQMFESWPVRTATDAANLDLFTYLPDDLLRKTDSASMSVALEVRCPMLDSSVVHWAGFADEDSLLRGGQSKGLLRAVARKYLPAEIVDRPKMGFAIPIGEWFRTDYGGMRTLLMDTLNSADPFPSSKLGLELDRSFIRQLVDEHMTGTRDHSQRLYMLLVLGIWVKSL